MNRRPYLIERGPCGISIEPADPAEGSRLGPETGPYCTGRETCCCADCTGDEDDAED